MSNSQVETEFRRIPKRNVWRALFDVRPAGAAVELLASLSSYVDLRVVRKQPFIKAAPKTIIPENKLEFIAPLLKRTALLLAIGAVFAGIGWAASAARNYIESRKNDIVATAGDIVKIAERGATLMNEMHFEEAALEFRIAAADLKNFEKSMKPALLVVSLSARALPENDYVKTVEMLRDARIIFSAAADLSDAAAKLAKIAPGAIFSGNEKMLEFLTSIRKSLATVMTAIENMESNRNSLSDSIAGEWFNRLPEMKLSLRQVDYSLGFFEQFLGAKEPFTVLFLFQNPAEIRATGGFIGSYGVLRMEKGRIAEFKVDDIYNPDGQREERGLQPFLPPRPLQRITPVWEARDANWFFDFRLSARKTADFISQIVGTPFDLVLALNPRPVAELIDLVGPIEMPEYGKTITGDNFWEETQFQTRAGKDRQINQPKRFLTILGPRLLEKLKEKIDVGDFPEFLRIISDGLSRKDILMWSPDQELQSLITSRGWDGKVAEIAPDEDYLAVVLSNIGGAKADYVMEQNYDLQTAIEPSGAITNTLTITRIHGGDSAPYPWWKARNVTYVRVFVPRGSSLLDIKGNSPEPELLEINEENYALDPDVTMTIGAAVSLNDKNVDIFEEAGRTVFGFWHTINPGQTRKIILKWKLPFKADFAPPRYTLIFQKQSGVEGVFRHGIELPRGSSVLSVEPLGAGAGRAILGNKFFWVAEPMETDIRHAISYQLR
jgi:hypothetical protein